MRQLSDIASTLRWMLRRNNHERGSAMICFNGLPKSLTRPTILCVVLTFTVLSAAAQKNGKTEAEAQKRVEAAAQKVKDAAEHGTPLTNTASTDVTGNTSVEATLIPASVARTVFGKEIANHY